ncbi:MAG TPA: Na+/H+ antiporter NhaA [Acidimicrobiales bacterium]|nr:Na+/H+ antiporter NhaA [Acidimicrobiales bacterium]
MATDVPEDVPPDALPGRRLPRLVRQFLRTEAAGGVVLLVAAVAALIWANSPWSGSYRSVWATELSIRVGRFGLTEDLRHWVNDGLMAIFFFVVGLEIKRELVRGDLRDPRTAAMPVIAAAGGMVVPALLFLLVNAGAEGSRGWGIPVATDIAFAIGVVALFGSRVPVALKLFLLTLAIVDDIGAIVVIAVFYAGELELRFLATAFGLVVLMVLLRRAGVVWSPAYALLGVGVWVATQASGVHATIAGVALGLLTPARALTPGAVARGWVADLGDDPTPAELDAMTRLARTSVSPAERLEHLLHPWTSFLVVPLFALANAGVAIEAGSFDAPGTLRVTAGVVLGLVLGKVTGITLAAWLALRSGVGRLPEGATWPMLVGIGFVAGIGFTVSLFVSELAFSGGALQDAAKIGVLCASTLSALVGAAVLMRATRQRRT